MKIAVTLIAVAVLAAVLVIVGCGKKSSETYGEAVDKSAKLTGIADVTGNPGAFIGKEVTVRGKIVKECPSGCWFYLEDKGAQIYVDLSPAGLSIDQYVGRTVTVKGSIEKEEDTGLMLAASGLAF
jgi:uncharacterized protein YdeI (BOF family)